MPQKRVYGTQNNDFLGADERGTTIIYGLGGNDRLENLDSDMDVLFGGEGADRLYGLGGDYLIGGLGNDTLYGTDITGGPGDDQILGGSILKYSGPQSAYEIKQIIVPGVGGVGYSIKDLRHESPDGNDLRIFPIIMLYLLSVTRLIFSVRISLFRNCSRPMSIAFIT